MHVLVPMDYSELSKEALRTAVTVHAGADITVLHVLDWHTSDRGPGGWGDTPDEFDQWLEGAKERADELFAEARSIADEHDAEVATETIVGDDAKQIVRYAEDHEIDLIVMGSHSRSLPARILLGSVSETVVRRAPVPVTVVR
ncbi:Nucleotide-binding universal stress protein, UspA family [Natronoarchaeum philippinense]|uniref:Nucleotide-binding universal stress protein, UspA family n=1 Tax=Natronoarchaeum philippinense TaxID=558529 RepID=A0A285N468_NATPI|nr:universal stress protein [Natronoarchaeum philippinense]SNZ03733.1 Nucleotide-binding universal stress protein, UspA family [Natronoarchaeum philippinense]